jgi:hypothetical protein
MPLFKKLVVDHLVNLFLAFYEPKFHEHVHNNHHLVHIMNQKNSVRPSSRTRVTLRNVPPLPTCLHCLVINYLTKCRNNFTFVTKGEKEISS